MARQHWTVKELLRVTGDYFQQKGLDNPRLSAEVLLAHLLQTDRIHLYMDPERPLLEEEVAAYRQLVRRRAQREPLQYIRGAQEFWSADFHVGPGVLIPRPESELLVEQALRIINDEGEDSDSNLSILDLGTGSGALIISMGLEITGASLYAADISGQALAIARINARKHGLEQRIRFILGDLFGPFKPAARAFDLIVTNPPYVASEVLCTLMPEIAFEPRVALDGGPGGTRSIEKIIKQAPDFLKPQGWLLAEMDPAQIEFSLGLVASTGRYKQAKSVKDYSRRQRIIAAQLL